ncbi:MAG: hypothetical protein ACJ78Q_20440, partial [Chloroflexia bacterium]
MTLRADDLRVQAAARPRAARAWWPGVAVVLLIGLLARLPLLAVDLRTSADVQIYQQWARAIAAHGLVEVYDHTTTHYPPLLLYLFGAAASLAGPPALSATSTDSPALIALLKLPSLLADLLTAALLAWALRARGPTIAVAACALYALSPAVLYVSSIWGQTDSVYTLFLVASVVALDRGAYGPAWVGYALALGTKIQSIALAPLLLGLASFRAGRRGLAACTVGVATWGLLAA